VAAYNSEVKEFLLDDRSLEDETGPQGHQNRYAHASAGQVSDSGAAAATCCRDWTKGITEWGMMMNDTLGDCTIAGVGHAVQVMER